MQNCQKNIQIKFCCCTVQFCKVWYCTIRSPPPNTHISDMTRYAVVLQTTVELREKCLNLWAKEIVGMAIGKMAILVFMAMRLTYISIFKSFRA